MKLTLLPYFLFGVLLVVVACENQSASSATEEVTQDLSSSDQYLEKGQKIAFATFGALSSELKAAMEEGGVKNAVQYCNTAALPITDKLAKENGASIKRTSLKLRNSKNAPTPEELAILEKFQQLEADSEAVKPIVEMVDDHTVAFYAPIRVNDFCLKCHGTVGASLLEEDYALIKELYPDDKAIAYEAGALRGIWSIQFPKEAPSQAQ